MAHTWTPSGGVVTLALDGVESGQISVSETLTGLEADQLYTFYLPVNPSVAEVNAFFQVVGGDTTVATLTGSQTLRVRGTTDGSGNITLRFGVQNAEAGITTPSSVTGLFLWLRADAGVYADTAGTTPATNGSIVRRWNDQSGNSRNATYGSTGVPSFVTSVVNGLPAVRWDGSTSNGLAFTGANGSSYGCFFIHKRVATSLNSGILGFNSGGGGQDVIVPSRGSDSSRQLGAWDSVNGWHQSAQLSTSEYQVVAVVRNNSSKTIRFYVDGELQDTRSYSSNPPATTGGWVGRTHNTGEILNGDIVELLHFTTALSDDDIDAMNQYLLNRRNVSGGGAGPATVGFGELTSCTGSGLSETGGTGAGADGDDTLPDPPEGGYPAPTGSRVFGASNIPTGGMGYWNSTIKQVRADWVANLLNTARSGGSKLFLVFGQTSDWVDGAGVFSYARWKATVDAFYSNTTARAILQDGIDDGTFIGHYVIDEPYWKGRWGKIIPLAELDKMCTYSKTLWPTWATTMRVAPTQGVDGSTYITRHIAGLDWLWAQYWQRYGDPTAYRDNNVARAQALEHGLVMGLNIADILYNESRCATAAELDYYGTILSSTSFASAFFMWRYESALYGQSGFEAALAKVRTNWESYDP